MNSSDIYSSIVASHTAPEWAVLREVSNATGGQFSRRADAVALNLWPSRGLEIRGFEIKVSRSDLKRELNDPAKADEIAKFCHTWCLATPVGLIKESDALPATWGLFEVKEDGTGRFKKAPTPRTDEEVLPPTRLFVAAIARAATAELNKIYKSGGWVRLETIQAKLDAEFTRGLNSAPDKNAMELNRITSIVNNVRPILKQFGIDVDGNRWDLRPERDVRAYQIGKAFVNKWGDNDAMQQATRRINEAIDALKEAKKGLGSLTVDKVIVDLEED